MLAIIIITCILICANTMTDGSLFRNAKLKITKYQIKTKIESTLSEYEDIVFSIAEYNSKTNPTKEEIKEYAVNMAKWTNIENELMDTIEHLEELCDETGLTEEELCNILYEIMIEIIEDDNYDYLIQLAGYDKSIILERLYQWKSDTDLYYQSEQTSEYQSESYKLDDFMDDTSFIKEDNTHASGQTSEYQSLTEREMKNAE